MPESNSVASNAAMPLLERPDGTTVPPAFCHLASQSEPDVTSTPASIFVAAVRDAAVSHAAGIQKSADRWLVQTSAPTENPSEWAPSGTFLGMMAECDALVRMANQTRKQLSNACVRLLLQAPKHDARVQATLAHWPLLTALRVVEPLVDGCGWTRDKETWLITIPEEALHLSAAVVERRLQQVLLEAHGRSWEHGTVRVLKGDPRITHKILGASYLCSPVLCP
jgi:hypothetical protein